MKPESWMLLLIKLDYEAGELDAFANYTSELIHEQRLMFGDLNKLYGDAEGAAVQGDITKARLIVGEMNTSLQAIPQLPELIEKFDVNGGGLVDIQYPSSIQDPEEFVAFVLTDDIAAPSIETYSSNYDEYLPQEKNDSQIEEGEQATPESLALKIGQYVEELNEQASSLNVQITNQQGEIDRVKSGFSMIPEGEKEEQLLYLNDLITEQAILETHAAQAQEASQKLHDDYQQELNSSSNPEEKEANYQNLISTAEEVYNFKKKIFISTSPVQAAATYQMNINGDLEEKSNEPKGIIPAAELSFNQDHSDQIETQMTQMMSQLRTDTKQNNFTVKKIDQQIESLNIEAENAFTQAVSYVEAAKSARLNKREQIISQANEQFNIAGNKKSEADALAQVKEHILAVNEESQQIVQQLSDESEQLQSAIKNENWGEVESLYTQAEQSFEQAAPKLDFSDEIDSETGKLNQNNNSISVNASEPIIAYELSNSGEVKKAIGNSDSEWASIDDFSDELNRQDKDISLSLSPELQVSASSKQNEIVSIVRASDSFYGGDIELLTVASLTSISSSSTPLVKNALLQVDSLQVGAKQLIEKRNAINQYYQETIRKAAALEDESLSILRKESLTVADVELANSKNIERNSLLFKASQAANIINSYEARILAQTNAISKGVYAAEQIEIATKNNNLDKAQSENNQFQNEIAQLNKQVVDDSQFDYANAVIITEAPAVIQSKEYQEYVIEGGVIQRNNQENLKQFFADNSTDLAVDLSSSDLIISSNANTKITEIKGDNTNQAGVLTQIDNQSEIQNNSSQNNNSEFANNDDNSSGISNNAELSNSNSSEIANPNLTDNVGGNETGLSNADNFESNNANTLADISNENTANAAINNNPTNTKKYIEAEPVAIQAYSAKEFKSSADIDQAVKEINTYSQAHTNNIGLYSGALVVLAEQKLKQSNAKSLEAETATDATIKKKAQLESKDYLNQALAIKALADEYSVYEAEELKKQELIVNSSSQIEQQIKSDNLNLSKKAFAEMQKQVNEFGEEPKKVMEQRYNQMIAQQSIISRQMDSAYSVSQELANESVKLLSDASEIRSDAEGKKNAFKRRKQLKKAHDMEIKATELQNKSEKALTLANNLYQQKQQVESLALLNKDFENLLANPSSINPSLANSSFVYAGIESRKQEVIEGHLSTTVKDTISVIPKQLATNTDDIHVFERETYKAQMITEELELIKREIALISQSNKSGLSEKEIYVLENNVKLLRSKTDSLEYQAKKAFEYANSILATLSEEEQKKAKGKNRNFDDYLQDLKKRIELLLSEASSLKQRAQRSNNLDTRKELYDQAKQKEEVAMYLILEEFEVIAQKNKTRYRKNQLILQQALMESASLQERDLMKSIFSQIDDYFNEAQQKREKANAPGISFNMRKILLQDAYSLEMKALDLQQQAKTMLDEHDMQAMLAYQVVESKTPETAISQVDTKLNAKDQNAQTSNTSQTTTINNVEIAQGNQAKNVNNSANQLKEKTQEKELSFAAPANGIVYKIQFSALQEIKPIDFFKGIPQITAQRVPNSNFIRYFSGSFTSIDQAMIRRNSVRASGYPDAFIKSWKNGEEVTLLSLRENTQNANISLSAGSASQAVVNNIDFSATNISSLQGVYYSVQVGVYSRPRTSAMIHGVSPLYHKRMKNGYWIYYSGIYKTIADATNRKNEIIQQGVKDAFIVAFSDGQTVSFSQARQDIKRGLSAPQEEDIVILEDASLQIDSQWNIAQVDAATQIANNVEGMVYKIQIGVYSNPVNLSWITSQLDDGMQMETFQNEQGKYVFSVGWFASIDEAKAKLSGVRDIVPDAFVIGFKNGKKVYVR